VARLLLDEGHEVHAPIRAETDRWRIDAIAPELQTFRGDLFSEDLGLLVRTIRPELCIHTAWYASAFDYLSARQNVALMGATLQLAMALADAGCRRFVGVGTCFEYDTNAGYLSETTPLGPKQLYSACKAGTWLALEQMARLTAMSVAWPRLFFVYGPFEPARRLVPSIIRSLLAGEEVRVTRGEQVRDFLQVEDAAAAILAIARSSVQGPINVGSGVPVTVRALVTRIGAAMDRQDLVKFGALPYSVGDPMFVCANNRLLREICGWGPKCDLHDGLAGTIDWWREHRSTQVP